MKNTGKPWTDDEIKLLGTMTDSAVAKQLGRPVKGVTWKRLALAIAPFTPQDRPWTKRELALLGKMPDGKLAAKLGCSRKHVFEVRTRRGVGAFGG